MPDAASGWTSVRGRRVGLAALVAVIGLGIVLRILLLAALPRFFGPGDPATYYAMASGVLRDGTPRVDFVWNYTILPTTISHVESYYELAYAYLLAGVMALFGTKPVVACAVSLVFGVLAPILTFAFARRFGARVAGVAACLVALEPWSIYYSGVIMKETLVSVIVILSIEGLRRTLLASASRWSTGFCAAGIVLAASAFDYEMLPILASTTAIALAVVRRDALWPYLLATAVVVGAALAVSLTGLGVPISGKLAFFSGKRLWTPEAHTRSTYASSLGLRRFVPLAYVLGSVLIKWYVPVIVLAWIGSRARALTRVDLVLPCVFVGCYLYFHGVPHDLWDRDFIPLLPVLAPLAALAVCRSGLWGEPLGRIAPRHEAIARGTVAVAVIAGAFIGVRGAYALHVAGVFPIAWMPWSVIGATAMATAVMGLLLRRGAFVFGLPAVQRALPALSVGVVLAAYSLSLPWIWIYDNPQFPSYESHRAAREQACDLLSGVEPHAAVMASDPAEVQLYSGHPTVLLPITHDVPTIDALRKRYDVRYLFTFERELEPGVPQALALRPVARRLGYVVYAFPAAGSAAHDAVAPPRAAPASAGAQAASR